MITQEELKEVLHYDPETGIFTWLKTVNSRAVKGSIAGCKSSAYIEISYNKEKYQAHRLAWFYMTGQWPEVHIDHINRDKQDNRFCNLRQATNSQNKANVQKVIQTSNTSKYKGVYFDRGRYRVRIYLNARPLNLGRFKDEIDAAKAYDVKALELFGEFALLNFP